MLDTILGAVGALGVVLTIFSISRGIKIAV